MLVQLCLLCFSFHSCQLKEKRQVSQAGLNHVCMHIKFMGPAAKSFPPACICVPNMFQPSPIPPISSPRNSPVWGQRFLWYVTLSTSWLGQLCPNKGSGLALPRRQLPIYCCTLKQPGIRPTVFTGYPDPSPLFFLAQLQINFNK